MNGKKRYIPIIALGALLISLLAILPVAGQEVPVKFIDPGDINNANDGRLIDNTPDEQEWSRQGGQAGILFEDVDLDRPVRRVLALATDTAGAGEGAVITAHSKVVKVPATGELVADANPQRSGAQLLKAGDYVYFDADGSHTTGDAADFRTLRKVVSVTRTDDGGASTAQADREYDITLDAAFPDNSSSMVIRRVNDTVVNESAFSDVSHLEIGLAEVVNIPASTDPITLAAPILPSQIAATYSTASTAAGAASRASGFDVRLGGNPDSRINERDVLAFKVAANAPGERLKLTDADDDEITPADPSDDPDDAGSLTAPGAGDYFVMYWAAVVNNTGSAITIQSQAASRPQGYTLKESSDGSGQFAVKADLVPVRVMTTWAAIPNTGRNDADGNPIEYDEGATVRLTVAAGGYGAGSALNPYLNVKRPAGERPSDPTTAVEVETLPDFSPSIPRLPVNERDSVTVNHPGGSETLRVETTNPVFANFSPAHNETGDDSRPSVSAQVTDGDSGLKESQVGIVFAIKDAGATSARYPTERSGNNNDSDVKLAPNDSDASPVSGGFEVTSRLDSNQDLDGDGEIWWWVKATDKAGNVAYSDRLDTRTSAAGDTEDDPCEVTTEEVLLSDANSDNPTCDPYVIKVDSTKPKMLHAETGRWWDSSLSTGDSDDKTEYRTAKANKASILAIFDEHLDPATVQASDFEVNDAQPSSADVFNVKVRDDSADGDGDTVLYDADAVPQFVGENRGYVFLTLSGDLTPNAQPKVEMVDKVSDLAGNQQSTQQRDAQANDRIGPTLTVSIVEGDRPVTKKDVTITVTSDENIGTPQVSFYLIRSYSPTDGDSVQTRGAEQKASARFVSAREYSAKLTPNTDGLYSIYVEATDSAGSNKGEIGKVGTVGRMNGDTALNGDMTLSTAIDVVGETDAILFERDKVIAKPDFDPAKTGVNSSYETDDPNGFLRIDYSAEANEYTSQSVPAREANASATPQITARAALSGDDLDTHGRLTVVSATLDGNDISGDLNPNSDGNIFQYHLDGMAVGEYDLEITVEDEAGNRNAAAHKGTIKIIERKPYKLELNPGWNLVSLPGQPADTDINEVIPADHPIDAVATYDPMVPGTWLTSLESGDGTFDGTVETIQAGLAYWIRTTSFEALEVDIPKPTPGATTTLLPTIQISQGWNLVPVLDVDGDFELATQMEDDNYFSGLTDGSVAAIYTYNTVTNSWASVSETGVELGKGYWVYATKPGVIVP